MSEQIKRIISLLFLLFMGFALLYSQDSVSANALLMELNNSFKAGTTSQYHYLMVSECIAALMEHGDSSSYPALFSVITLGYPEVIVYEAIGALDLIQGNLQLFLLNVIENNPPAEKYIAFRIGINSHRLTVSERGLLSELALELSFAYTEDNADLTAMRYASVNALAELQWKRANPLAIRHYYRVLTDYMDGKASKTRLIEAIACLGAVGDSDAALILVLQLGLINARTESTGVFDPELTVAVINALGNIGDNAAFNHLLYTSNLSYDDNITSAAAEAIARLKW